MKSLSFSLIFFFIGAILASCADRFRIGEETFSLSSEGLHKRVVDLSEYLNQITPTKNPALGTALVLIPSDSEIQKNFIEYGSGARYISEENLDFLTTLTRMNFQYMANAIQKRAIFNSVTVERYKANPSSHPVGEFDFLVFADVEDWYIRGKENPKALGLNHNRYKPLNIARTLTFLDSLGQLAYALSKK